MQNTGDRRRGQAEGFSTAEERTEPEKMGPGKDPWVGKESSNMVHVHENRQRTCREVEEAHREDGGRQLRKMRSSGDGTALGLRVPCE